MKITLVHLFRFISVILVLLHTQNLCAVAIELDSNKVIRQSVFKISSIKKTISKGTTIGLGTPSLSKKSTKNAFLDKNPLIVNLSEKNITYKMIGKDNVLLPKVLIPPVAEEYRIFYNDTVFQPSISTVKFPDGTVSLKLKSRDNAVYNLRFLDVEQGLPSSYILSMIEDHNNYLWIGFSDEGVVRYDGNMMFHFNPQKGFPLKSVRSILEDRNGYIWFGSFDEGVIRYDGTYFTHYTTKQGLPDNTIYDIYEDSNGYIWFATGNGLCKYDGNAFIVYTKNEGLLSTSLRTITEDNSGNLWIGTWGSGFFMFDSETFTHYDIESPKGLSNISKICYDKNNKKIWIAFSKGYFGCLSDKNLTLYQCPGDESQRFKDIVIDNDGILYVSTLSSGFFRFDEKLFEFYSPDEGLSSKDVSVLLLSKNKTIVAGTRGGGINFFNPFSFRHYTDKQGVNNALIFAISQEKNGDLWFGTEIDGIFKFDGYNFYNYLEKQGLTSEIIISSLNDSKDNLWFGAWRGGLIKIKDNKLTKFLKKDGLSDLNVSAIFEDNANNIWVGTWGGGAFMYDGQNMSAFNDSIGLNNGNIFDINQDTNNNIWFATEGGGLYRLYSVDIDSKIFYNYNNCNGLEASYFNCITKDIYGNLWFGAHYGGGIYLLTVEQQKSLPENIQFKRINLDNNTANQSIQSITFDKQNRLWAGTDKGLILLPEIYDSKGFLSIKKMNKTIYFLGDEGLFGLDFLRKSLFCDSDNRLWMGTGKCMSMIDLMNYNNLDKAPLAKVQMIKIDNYNINFKDLSENYIYQQYLSDSLNVIGISCTGTHSFSNLPINLTLPYNLNHITFYFSSQNGNALDNLTYQIKIEGLDKEWSTVTGNEADYRNIPYGKHIFKVRAKGLTEIWGTADSFEFTILPPFWLTWWAYLIYIILFIVSILLFSWWRSFQLIKHKKKLSQIVAKRTKELAGKNRELNQLLVEVSSQRDEIEKQRDTVFEQKLQLESAHNELSNSIDYAVRIQAAIFPNKDELNIFFPENFTLLLPRDKVSGDFYFWSEVNKKIIIAVADCTGHGVPGAFMSLLSITLLQEIVNNNENTDTSKILDYLRNGIITSLKQEISPRTQKDGLDIALISIDRNNKEIQFSGAHNSIYHISKGQLTEYKGDRNSVSINIKTTPFSSHIFNYKKNDLIYMFTDGYSDQFGGENRSKLKSKAFKELIYNNIQYDMKTQKENFHNFFIQWKGSCEQIDDVALLGIRLE